MKGKKEKTTEEIIKEIVVKIAIYEMLFLIIYIVLMNVLYAEYTPMIAVYSIIIQAVLLFVARKSIIESTLKEQRIYDYSLPRINKVLTITTVIILIIMFVVNFLNVNHNVKQTLASEPISRMTESYLTEFYDEDETKEILDLVSQDKKNYKEASYFYLATLMCGAFISYSILLMANKRNIKKYINN